MLIDRDGEEKVRNDDRITIETINQDNRKEQGESYFEEAVLELSEKLQLANNILRAILETSHDFMIFGLDTRYRYLSFNNQHKEMMKSQWGQVIQIGSNMLDLMDSFDERETMKSFFDRALAGEQFVSLEEYKDKNTSVVLGKNYWAPVLDKEGKVTGLVCFIQDVTEQEKSLKEMLEEGTTENKIESMSYRDHLTGIYNRKFYEKELERLNNAGQLPLSIILVEVNNLREINNRYGHAIGDEFIRRAAHILDNGCRGNDVIARYGGNRFVILMPKTEGAKVERAIERIQGMLEDVKIQSSRMSVSFGFGTKYEENEKVEDVYKMADRYIERQKEAYY